MPNGEQQFQYIKLPDGSYGQFPANASDEQISGVIAKNYPETATYRPTAQEQAAHPVATAMAQEGLTDLNEAQAKAAFAGQHPILNTMGDIASMGAPGLAEAPWDAMAGAAGKLALRGGTAVAGGWGGQKVGGAIGGGLQELTGIPGLETAGRVVGGLAGGLAGGLGLSKIEMPETVDLKGFKIPIPGWIRSAGNTGQSASQAAALGQLPTPPAATADPSETIPSIKPVSKTSEAIVPRQLIPREGEAGIGGAGAGEMTRSTSPAGPGQVPAPAAQPKPRLRIPGVAEPQELPKIQTPTRASARTAPTTTDPLIEKFMRGDDLSTEERLTLSNRLVTQLGPQRARQLMGQYMGNLKYMGGAQTK